MSDIKIACVGNLTDDQLLYIDAIPSLDDVAYVNKSTRCMGGRGALVALILGRAKLVPSLVTVLPQSEKAYEYETFLNKNNVCTKAVHFSETSDSLFEVIIAISREQKNCISFFKPTDILFEVNEVQKETVRDSDIVYFSTHKRSFNRVLLNEIDLSKSCIVHNVSSYFLQDSEYTDLMLQKSNILIFNESEEELLLRNLGISGARELFNIAPPIGGPIFYSWRTRIRSLSKDLARGKSGSTKGFHNISCWSWGCLFCWNIVWTCTTMVLKLLCSIR